MANTYKNAQLNLTTTSRTTLYTCPAATTGLVNTLHISNVDGTDDFSIDVEVYDSSAATYYYILYQGVVPPGAALNALDKPIVLEASDSIPMTASAVSGLHTIGSIMEIT